MNRSFLSGFLGGFLGALLMLVLYQPVAVRAVGDLVTDEMKRQLQLYGFVAQDDYTLTDGFGGSGIRIYADVVECNRVRFRGGIDVSDLEVGDLARISAVVYDVTGAPSLVTYRDALGVWDLMGYATPTADVATAQTWSTSSTVAVVDLYDSTPAYVQLREDLQ